ncbi:hypothetical protein HDV05_004508 [Chytridiales sp. JEL 0842]|nr:hypothetical protein HDV05_004508 [Chytridiales sp. JEL 0842]
MRFQLAYLLLLLPCLVAFAEAWSFGEFFQGLVERRSENNVILEARDAAPQLVKDTKFGKKENQILTSGATDYAILAPKIEIALTECATNPKIIHRIYEADTIYKYYAKESKTALDAIWNNTSIQRKDVSFKVARASNALAKVKRHLNALSKRSTCLTDEIKRDD